MANIIEYFAIQNAEPFTKFIIEERNKAPEIRMKFKLCTGGVSFFQTGKKRLWKVTYADDDYGVKFRAWNKYPTEEERYTTPWADDLTGISYPKKEGDMSCILKLCDELEKTLIYEAKTLNQTSSRIFIDEIRKRIIELYNAE